MKATSARACLSIHLLRDGGQESAKVMWVSLGSQEHTQAGRKALWKVCPLLPKIFYTQKKCLKQRCVAGGS